MLPCQLIAKRSVSSAESYGGKFTLASVRLPSLYCLQDQACRRGLSDNLKMKLKVVKLYKDYFGRLGGLVALRDRGVTVYYKTLTTRRRGSGEANCCQREKQTFVHYFPIDSVTSPKAAAAYPHVVDDCSMRQRKRGLTVSTKKYSIKAYLEHVGWSGCYVLQQSLHLVASVLASTPNTQRHTEAHFIHVYFAINSLALCR